MKIAAKSNRAGRFAFDHLPAAAVAVAVVVGVAGPYFITAPGCIIFIYIYRDGGF